MDSSGKIVGIASLKLTNFDKNPCVKEELDKCVMLCSNCHREAHFEAVLAGQKAYRRPKNPTEVFVCQPCGKTFTKNYSTKKFCSDRCAKLSIRRVKNRPSKEQLLSELETSNFSQMGVKYGVSDNTIRKWLKDGTAEEKEASSRSPLSS